MKNVFYVLIAIVFLFSCKKDKEKVVNETFTPAAQDTLIAQGSFSSNAHPTSGTVKLYSKSGAKTLVFEGFKTDPGPDLRVYLSKAANNTAFVELGTLKGTSGNFNYPVNSAVNTAEFKYVLIWCEDFSVLFGNALLQ
ncbi:MAG: DM13 domain-containing protein [Bacteroidota bacterium]